MPALISIRGHFLSAGCPGPWARAVPPPPAPQLQDLTREAPVMAIAAGVDVLMHGQYPSHTCTSVQQGTRLTWSCPWGAQNHGCNSAAGPTEPGDHLCAAQAGQFLKAQSSFPL